MRLLGDSCHLERAAMASDRRGHRIVRLALWPPLVAPPSVCAPRFVKSANPLSDDLHARALSGRHLALMRSWAPHDDSAI